MGKLSANQAHVLYQIVKYARREGGWVPTDRELGRILGISAKMANDYRWNIEKKLKCFKRDGRRFKVDDDVLCTQPDSALYLFIFYERSRIGRISKTPFHNLLLSAFPQRASSDRLQHIFERAVENGYLRIVKKTDYLEPGPRLSETLDYLELLLGWLVQDEIVSRAGLYSGGMISDTAKDSS